MVKHRSILLEHRPTGSQRRPA